jgi:hypothetical protein
VNGVGEHATLTQHSLSSDMAAATSRDAHPEPSNNMFPSGRMILQVKDGCLEKLRVLFPMLSDDQAVAQLDRWLSLPASELDALVPGFVREAREQVVTLSRSLEEERAACRERPLPGSDVEDAVADAFVRDVEALWCATFPVRSVSAGLGGSDLRARLAEAHSRARSLTSMGVMTKQEYMALATLMPHTELRKMIARDVVRGIVGEYSSMASRGKALAGPMLFQAFNTLTPLGESGVMRRFGLPIPESPSLGAAHVEAIAIFSDGELPDVISHRTASSSWHSLDPSHSALTSDQYWCSADTETAPRSSWLQIEVPLRRGSKCMVSGVRLRGNSVYYNTSFEIQVSRDGGSTWQVMNAAFDARESSGTPEVFKGCADGETPVDRRFAYPIEATHVRYIGISHAGGWHVARVALLGGYD